MEYIADEHVRAHVCTGGNPGTASYSVSWTKCAIDFVFPCVLI